MFAFFRLTQHTISAQGACGGEYCDDERGLAGGLDGIAYRGPLLEGVERRGLFKGG